MCGILPFSAIGAAITGAVTTAAGAGAVAATAGGATGLAGGLAGISAAALGAGTLATTAIGLGATGLTLGGLAAGIGKMTNKRAASKSSDDMKNQISSTIQNTPNGIDSIQKTATQLKETATKKRTLNSLRIPTKQATTAGVNPPDTGTGLNIPM